MDDKREVQSLYGELLHCWNRRDAAGFAALFADDGNVVGFDGSVYERPAMIESELSRIFAEHPTAAYVAKIRNVRLIMPDVALVSAVAGMVPPGQSDIKPAVNTVQTMIAAKQGGRWRIAVFQNTPAAFHGRPDLAEKLTAELRQALEDQRKRS
jgi:uncharacterized protein (TIGR02246 family)